jgi:uncharacterized protein YcnI
MASDIFIKTSNSVYSVAKYIKIKTSSSVWSSAKSVFLMLDTVGWTKVWPLSGAYVTTYPYITSSASGTTHLIPTSPLRVGTTYYGRNGVFNANGWTISSYSYQWIRYSAQDRNDASGQTTISSGTYSSSIPYTTTASDDKKYLSFYIKANVSNSIYSAEAESGSNIDEGRLFVIRQPPINTAMSLTSDTRVGTAINYSSTWNTTPAYAPEALRTKVAWYKNSTASLTGATLIKSNLGSVTGAYSYTPVTSDVGNYIIVKETTFNSGTDYNDGVLTLANTIGSGTEVGVSAVAYTSAKISDVVVAPTSLTATSNSGNGVYLNWNSVPGANYYEIYWQAIQGTGPINQSTYADFGQDNSITTNSFLDTTISPGTTRYYRVRARSEATSNGSNCSNWYPAPASNAIAGSRIKPGAITNCTAYNFQANTAHGYFTTGTNTDMVQYRLRGVQIGLVSSTYLAYPGSSSPYQVSINISSLFSEKVWNSDTYSPATTYKGTNTVWYAGNQYKAIKYVYRASFPYDEIGFSGIVPTNTTYWQINQQVFYYVGDYVTYNGNRYYVISFTTGTYPNSSAWSSVLGEWVMEVVPYYGTGSGDTAYSNSTRQLLLGYSAATDPISIAAGPTFDNITSSSFRTNYTSGNYANYVYIETYKTSDFSAIPNANYPKLRTVSTITQYTDTPGVTLPDSTQYTVTLTPRYYYSVSPDIHYDGIPSTNYVTTLLAAPGSFTYSIANGTVAPTWPIGAGINISGSVSNIMTVTWNAATNANAGTGTGENSYGDQVFGVYGSSLYRLNTTTDTWGYSSSGNEYATVNAYNYNRSSIISWNAAANAGSYKVNYTISGATSGNGTFTSSALSSTTLNYPVTVGTGGGTVVVNSVTAYSTTDGSGASFTTGTLSGSNTNVPTVAITSQTSSNFYLTYTAPASAPVNTALPSVSPSSGVAGSVNFTTTDGSWSGNPYPTFTYQWQYQDQPGVFLSITGQTSSSYSPPSNFFSIYVSPIRCKVTATNSVSSVSAFSGAVTVNASIPTVAMTTTTNITASGATINWASTNQSYATVDGVNVGNVNSYTFTGKNASQFYQGSVVVYSTTGNSATATYAFSTSAAPSTAPSTVTVSGDNALTKGGTFRWTADGSPAPTYRIVIGYNASSSTGPFSTKYDSGIGSITTSIRPGYDISGYTFVAGYYRCTVIATNSAGSATGSNITYMS